MLASLQMWRSDAGFGVSEKSVGLKVLKPSDGPATPVSLTSYAAWRFVGPGVTGIFNRWG